MIGKSLAQRKSNVNRIPISTQVIACFLCLLPTLTAAVSISSATSISENYPQAAIERTLDRLKAMIRRQGQKLEHRPELVIPLVDEVVTPYIDMPRVTRLILGRHWSHLDDAQRNQFSQSFRLLLLGMYANHLSDYRECKVTFLPSPSVSPQVVDAMVRSIVSVPGGDARRIDYRLYKKAGRWRIYDVVAGGISFVVMHRKNINEYLSRRAVDDVLTGITSTN